ncbi:TIGR03084 family metal-binding protein [Micromonospora lutea]|uniref:Wyosine base formation n=1 Tax=Micromonospora lutea TaxID=419825 RepID=A0ABQ4IYG2_9ACTN|nr:TIGR03084 family metal-binding protein [Micromonospora lutea]GIJ22958.1 wyosine base formation [Micromonospora lutea]
MDESNVFADLADDCAEFDQLLDTLDPDDWARPTPAVGWEIRHQVAHLSAVFRMAAIAASDAEAFRALTAQLSDDFDANVAVALSRYLDGGTAALRGRWREEWTTAVEALAGVPAGQVVPWLVRPLPAPVLAAAGMMELFAHGQDVADALGRVPERTDRIRHVVDFAVRTWDFGYLSRGLTPVGQGFRFELTAPSGEVWVHGPPDAELIEGPAVDLCLLVTRRRHRDDLALRATGVDAEHWLDLAQAYRGPAGPGRRPGQFSAGAAMAPGAAGRDR